MKRKSKSTDLPVDPPVMPKGQRGTGARALVPATPPRAQQIPVATDQGTILVKALVWGPLAIHEGVGYPGWTITHVPTGLVIHRELEREQAVALVAAIRERGLNMKWRTVQDCPQAVRQALLELKGGSTGGVKVNISIEVK